MSADNLVWLAALAVAGLVGYVVGALVAWSRAERELAAHLLRHDGEPRCPYCRGPWL